MTTWPRFERTHAASAGPAAGSDAALLADFYRRYRLPLVNYFGKRIREAYDIDDLVQEVFIRLARRSMLSEIGHIDGYVFQTAANVMRDRARRQAARRYAAHDEIQEERLAGDDISPEHVLLARESLDRAIAALEELPVRTRQVFVLRRYEGMKHEEIARHLCMSVSGVRFHMQTAKVHLARRLEHDI